MSLYDYNLSREIAAKDYPFYAILQALARKADTHNLEKIRREWPEIVEELRARYTATGGILPGEAQR